MLLHSFFISFGADNADARFEKSGFPLFQLPATCYSGALARMLSPLVSSVARRFYCSSRMVGKNAFIVLAEGAEEMEFVVSADILRRAGVSL